MGVRKKEFKRRTSRTISRKTSQKLVALAKTILGKQNEYKSESSFLVGSFYKFFNGVF